MNTFFPKFWDRREVVTTDTFIIEDDVALLAAAMKLCVVPADEVIMGKSSVFKVTGQDQCSVLRYTPGFVMETIIHGTDGLVSCKTYAPWLSISRSAQKLFIDEVVKFFTDPGCNLWIYYPHIDMFYERRH